MSIILGPYDNRDDRGEAAANHQESPGEDELFVFGYACKLFRDDDKALLENNGQLLIPWMGDGSLMIDRYDLRNRLEDKSQFGLKPILPRRRTQEEDDLEEMLDKERYLALGVDVLEHELLEEEFRKRQREQRGGYQAVGFAYKERGVTPLEVSVSPSFPLPPRRPEHPPTSTVDVAGSECERFVPPPGLDVPGHIQQPVTKKLHSIIERTAGFVARQGTQMEIMIKAKQKHSPLFSFLSLYDPLHSYYRYLLQMIGSGGYTPLVTEGEEKGEGGGSRETVKETGKEGGEEEEESDSGDSDDEGFELHPLLRVSTAPRSSPRPTGTHQSGSLSTNKSSPPLSVAATTAATDTTQSSASFSRSLSSVNAAPSLEAEGGGAWHTADSTHHHPRPSFESQQYQTEMGSDEQQYNHTSEGNSLHPQPSDFANQSSLEAYYHRLRAEHLQTKMNTTVTFTPPPGRRDPGPPPPPPDLQPIIDKTAEYVARNSDDFERTVLERHCGDPKFGFLNPWDQYYPYYKFRLAMNKEKAAEEALAVIKSNHRRKKENQFGKQVQKLSGNGAVSFKLQPKKKAVLETDAVDLGPPAEEDEEEEEEGEEGATPVICQQEDMYGGGHQGMYGVDGTVYHHTQQPMGYHGGHAHYTSEGMVYSGNGEVGEEGEEVPPTKRAKINAEIDVMDNKVQEFLSQVKAVLDT